MWQLKWDLQVFRMGAASGWGRAPSELQQLRLKAPPFAGDDEALIELGEAAEGFLDHGAAPEFASW